MSGVKLIDRPLDKACSYMFHMASVRHVLILEADLPDEMKQYLIQLSNAGRVFSNHLRSIFIKRIEQLHRLRRYRALSQKYKKLKESGKDCDKAELESVAKEMEILLIKKGLTQADVREQYQKIYKRYGLPSVFAQSLADDVWMGLKKVLLGNGKRLNYLPKNRMTTLRTKQIDKIILIRPKDDDLIFTFKRKEFSYIHHEEDRFEREEISAIVNWFKNSETIEHNTGLDYVFFGKKVDTHRVCSAAFVFKEIRGKIRVYIHLMVEGAAFPKKRADGTLRHKRGKGVVGCDIGTQTIAYVSPEEVGLKNLAERGSSIEKNERKQKLILRKMDRSRRSMNPEHFNPDGTCKKGRKKWFESNRYKKLLAKYRNLCRKNAVNRKLSIQEDVNRLRSSGDVFITEPKNAMKLQKRASGPTEQLNEVMVIVKKDGTQKTVHKCKRKKRFGKSIQNRCPGFFQAEAQKKFPVYIEVPHDYRASQYDHTSGDYVKHKLSERMFKLSDGSKVQRDLYSAFLLAHYFSWGEYVSPDPASCHQDFEWFQQRSDELIKFIKDNRIDVKNSGIRV